MKSIYNLRKWAIFFLVISLLASILFSTLLRTADLGLFHYDKQKSFIENFHQLTLSFGPLIIFTASLSGVFYFILFLIKSNKNRFKPKNEHELDYDFSEVKIGFKLSAFLSTLQLLSGFTITAIVIEIISFTFERDLSNTLSAFAFLGVLGLYGIGTLLFVLFTFRNRYIQFGV